MAERKAQTEINRYITGHLRALMRVERAVQGAYTKELRRMAHEAAESVKQGGGLLHVMATHEERLTDIINSNAQLIIPDFYRRGIVAIGIEQKLDGRNKITTIIRQWMEEYGLTQAKNITGTSRDRINAIIAKGFREGESAVEISKNILTLGRISISATRARTIAITETHNAAMYAGERGAADTGLELLKRWVSVEDARTRPSHAVVDEQGYIPMQDKYRVGGVLMQRPGDPSAPAHEIIRCRCAQIYKPVGFDFD